jgi:hypothetical protein
MFRLFIIIVFLHFYTINFAQTSKRELNYLLEQNLEQEDYFEAAKYCDSLMQKDSIDYTILETYVNILIEIKDFKKADILLNKICALHNDKLNYNLLFKLGLVNQQLGKYEESLNFFNRTLKLLDKKSDKIVYAKVEQEIRSCIWANEHCKDSLDYGLQKIKGVTNSDSEFGHTIIGSKLIISTLRCNNCIDSLGFNKEGYTNKIYTVSKENGSELNEVKTINSSINHTANGTFSLDKKKFYYSSCNNLSHNKKCKLLVSNYQNGEWSIPDTLNGEINDSNFTYTMPSFAKIQGKDYLFFCSDAKNSIGGLDIYIGIINQNSIKEIKPVKYINSTEDDVTPFFDNENSTLYFASSWFNGYGGYDIFKTRFAPNKINKIENLGLPFNSSNNDLYPIKDSLNYYITSNRNHISENKTCCNDIYLLKPKEKQIENSLILQKKEEETDPISLNSNNTTSKNIEKLEQLIPISLYFHNDIPNPKSTDSITKKNYLETFEEYIQLLPTYQSNYSAGLQNDKKTNAEVEIQKFFIENIQKGKEDLDKFLDVLILELKKGEHFELIFKGYASPLAQNDYNKLLSKRRISAVKNYISFYKNGVFLHYLIANKNGENSLSYKEESFGEFLTDKLVSDNPNDKKNSIFSKKAALERKVQIIGFKIK